MGNIHRGHEEEVVQRAADKSCPGNYEKFKFQSTGADRGPLPAPSTELQDKLEIIHSRYETAIFYPNNPTGAPV